MSFHLRSKNTLNPAFLADFCAIGEVKNVEVTGMLYAQPILSLQYVNL